MWIAETGGAAGVNAWPDVSEVGIASIFPFTAQDFMRGLAAARQDRFEEATRYVERLRERTERARNHVAGVVASRYDTVTPEEIEQGVLLAQALEGTIQFAQGDQVAGLARVREAIAISDTLAFEYGPPFPAKPLAELLGDLLLAAGKPDEAAAAYGNSLAVHPNRKLSVEGLTAARAAAWTCRHCAAKGPAGN
jgi:tetratricopeptide (TPR) repeat protein